MKLRKNPALLNAHVPAPPPLPRPAPTPVPSDPEPLVIPTVLNTQPSLLGDRVSILNVSAVRQPISNGKTHRSGV